MINLIPPAAIKIVKKEYWIRVVSVWMIMAGVALVMITALKIPLYVIVNSQLVAFADLYESAANDDLEFKNYTEQIKKANEIGAILNTTEDDYRFSEIISKIDSIADEDITIENYNLALEKEKLSSVTVGGLATTRKSLANFKEQLEAESSFSSAILPLSNLAKDVNVPFNIEIKLANLKTES